MAMESIQGTPEIAVSTGESDQLSVGEKATFYAQIIIGAGVLCAVSLLAKSEGERIRESDEVYDAAAAGRIADLKDKGRKGEAAAAQRGNTAQREGTRNAARQRGGRS